MNRYFYIPIKFVIKLVAIFVLFMFSHVQAEQEDRIEFSYFEPDKLGTELIRQINELRQIENKQVLTQSTQLTKAAQGHASAMIKRDFFSHVSPIRGHKHLSNRLSKVGIKNVYAAENLSLAFAIELSRGEPFYTRFDSQDTKKQRPIFSLEYKGAAIPMRTYADLAAVVASQWHNSESHRLNMMGEVYNSAGIGAQIGFDENKIPIVKVVMAFANLSI